MMDINDVQCICLQGGNGSFLYCTKEVRAALTWSTIRLRIIRLTAMHRGSWCEDIPQSQQSTHETCGIASQSFDDTFNSA